MEKKIMMKMVYSSSKSCRKRKMVQPTQNSMNFILGNIQENLVIGITLLTIKRKFYPQNNCFKNQQKDKIWIKNATYTN